MIPGRSSPVPYHVFLALCDSLTGNSPGTGFRIHWVNRYRHAGIRRSRSGRGCIGQEFKDRALGPDCGGVTREVDIFTVGIGIQKVVRVGKGISLEAAGPAVQRCTPGGR